MPENPAASDTQTPPAWSPEEAVKNAHRSGVQFSVEGDQIMVKGFLPAYLQRELEDPANYGLLHDHLSEVARQEALVVAEKARQDRENDWAARVAYGNPGGGFDPYTRVSELARIRQELERRTAPAKSKRAPKK